MKPYFRDLLLALQRKRLFVSLLGVLGAVFGYGLARVSMSHWDVDLVFAAIIFGLILWSIIIVAEAAYQSATRQVTRQELQHAEALEAAEHTLTATQKLRIGLITLATVGPVVVVALVLALLAVAVLGALGVIEVKTSEVTATLGILKS